MTGIYTQKDPSNPRLWDWFGRPLARAFINGADGADGKYCNEVQYLLHYCATSNPNERYIITYYEYYRIMFPLIIYLSLPESLYRTNLVKNDESTTPIMIYFSFLIEDFKHIVPECNSLVSNYARSLVFIYGLMKIFQATHLK